MSRLVILGTYNSGSTALAGMMHRLGVDMGAPFWSDSDDASANNNYEPYDLACHLRKWWNEPGLYDTQVTPEQRSGYLRNWVRARHCYPAAQAVGVKHPLTILSAEDFIDGWGDDTRFIWARRPLEKSIEGLEMRGWFERAAMLQTSLYDRIARFAATREVEVFEMADTISDPGGTAARVQELLSLPHNAGRVAAAVDFVTNPPQPVLSWRDRLHWRKRKLIRRLAR